MCATSRLLAATLVSYLRSASRPNVANIAKNFNNLVKIRKILKVFLWRLFIWCRLFAFEGQYVLGKIHGPNRWERERERICMWKRESIRNVCACVCVCEWLRGRVWEWDRGAWNQSLVDWKCKFNRNPGYWETLKSFFSSFKTKKNYFKLLIESFWRPSIFYFNQFREKCGNELKIVLIVSDKSTFHGNEWQLLLQGPWRWSCG